MTMDALKKCPDCAEMVRAEARVCRFCGYRFDGNSASAGALLEAIRRTQVRIPLPELLLGWGTELRDQEEVEFFGYCGLDRLYGFLLVTSDRVAFYSDRGSNREIEWLRTELREATRARRYGRRALRLGGPGRSVLLHRFESRYALGEIARALGITPEA
jgi:hypothetical protein